MQKKTEPSNQPSEEKKTPTFGIQRIYVEDASFEVPDAPEVFKKDWKPEVKVDLNTKQHVVDDQHYNVLLVISVTVKLDGKVAFIAEVKQAGIFEIRNFTEQQRKPLLAAYCPSILFPYAREIISSLVGHGSFPPLHLAPINFDAIYEQKVREEQKKRA